MRTLQNETRRPAATVILFAILLIPLLGMLAFAIDIGWIALVRTDLQTAADSAALAAAENLQQFYVQYTLAGIPGSQVSQSGVLGTATGNTAGSPVDTAKRFASYNKAGNVSITVRDQDISFGFTDAQGSYHTNYSSYNGGFPNSVQVTTRRDSLKNTPVSLFFGSIFGVNSKELNASATATIYSGDITSLQVIPGVNAHILPVALDMNIWKAFYDTGKSPDGSTHYAVNNYPQLKIYPDFLTNNDPGSFGLMDVGPPQNNVPAFRSWIDDGETPNDISYLLNNNLLPVSMDSPKNWKAGPGLKSTLQSNFADQMGVPNLIPLFLPYGVTNSSSPPQAQNYSQSEYRAGNGNGQGNTYAVVGFVGVAVSQADGSGSNMDISVQPHAIVDPTAIIQNPRPVGTQTSQFGSSTAITTFISAKLTQ